MGKSRNSRYYRLDDENDSEKKFEIKRKNRKVKQRDKNINIPDDEAVDSYSIPTIWKK